MPQELVDGIFIIGDPLALHPGALIHDSFFGGLGICIELRDYLRVVLSHGLCQLGPLPPGNLLLEFFVLPFS